MQVAGPREPAHIQGSSWECRLGGQRCKGRKVADRGGGQGGQSDCAVGALQQGLGSGICNGAPARFAQTMRRHAVGYAKRAAGAQAGLVLYRATPPNSKL